MCDLIIKGANIITLDKNNPKANSIAIEKGKIVFVGNFEEASFLIKQHTKFIDLKGKTIIPGFNDAHLHLVAMGDSISRLKLFGLNSFQIIERIKEHYKGIKPGQLISGHGWDTLYCENPHKDLLDKHFPDNPVVLYQFSGHGAWVNSYMLKKLGYSKKIPSQMSKHIHKDENNNLTGLIYDSAIYPLIKKRMLRMNWLPSVRNNLILEALEKLKENGITSIQENTWVPTTVNYYQKLNKKEELTCRISCWPYGPNAFVSRFMDFMNYDDEWVTKGPLKYFVDGAFSTRTAWLSEPYENSTTNFGQAVMSSDELRSVLKFAAKCNRQICFHAIGDRAVTEIVNAVEETQLKYDWVKSLRIRIDHAQLIKESDLERIYNLGIVVCAQPSALVSPEKDIALVGKNRAEKAYPFKAIIQSGIPLAFGSDVPGEIDYNPLKLIHLAVNRTLGEQISVEEALYSYTMGSAYAQFMENRKGSLTVGKLADLVVLSDDIFNVKKENIKDIKILMTILNGKVIYENMH